jgi:tetratricopeptide (TPR) repeat protein
MPEHTIPESLIDQIRSGRAVLVVGAGIGIPTWKQLLEAMTRELEARGRGGDAAAARDLGKLLHKGSLTRAVGFLARSLGEEACDRIVAEMWQAHDLPAVPRLLAELPFRHIWTTFPGDLIERGLSEHSPEGWPPPRVATYRDLGELSRQRRTLVKILGNVDSFVVAPGSVRRALARAVDLRDYARDCYVEGTLVFVGFRFGDPDLAALLDRVFGMFEPPRGTHYLVGAGLGPVTVDELMADHHVEVIAIGGRAEIIEDTDDDAGEPAGDATGEEAAVAAAPGDTGGKKKGKNKKGKAVAKGPAADPDKATLEWLAALRDACQEAGLSLSQSRPAPDDLDGWLALLADELPEAKDAIDVIERRARDAGDHERLVELLLGRIDLEPAAEVRAGLLVQLAASYQATGDAASALTALTTAWHVLPEATEAVTAAEALAAATGDWAGLVAEAAELTSELTGAVAAIWFARLGRWYAEKLDRPDYAAASLRRALELDATNGAAHAALADLLRAQQKWAELAEALRAHLAVEINDGHRVDLYLALGDLAESQLAQTAKAIEAYQAAAELDDESGEALAALERLYRRSERWADLARVLDRRAELAAAAGDAGQAAAFRRELATLRAEKLGDLEGAIARYEAALAADPADRTALRALEDLYDRTGRTDDYLRTLERFVEQGDDVAGPAERLTALRTLAAALEDRPGAAQRAIAAYQRVLELDPAADDAYRGLARLYQATQQPYERVAILERHVAAARTPADRAALLATVAQAQEVELADPHRAIESHLAVLAIDEAAKPSLIALARLYQRIEAWERAVEVLVKHAGLLGDVAEAAPLLAEAGRIAEGPLADPALAERHLDQALARDPAHYPALALLATLHDRGGSARLAAEAHERAEKAAPSRLDRAAHLVRAAELAASLGDDARAIGLWERVLRVDPEHVVAGRHVADHLIAEQRWDDALPTLEMLAQRSSDDDRTERARRETQLGQAYEALHRTEKAVRHFGLAVEADPDNLDAALGLAAALLAQAQAQDGVAGATVDAARWQEVARRHRDVLARHGSGLADGQVADVWYRIGLSARALGDDAGAEDALRRALDREPLHAATLDAMVEVAGRRGDWAAVIEARRAQLERAPVALQVKLLEEIGDLERGKRKDATAAAGAYLQALELAPGSHGLLHKLLDAHTEQKQWRRAIDALDELAAVETSGERRARYLYAAAVIARDEIGDPELAVDRFGAALDAQPDTPKAFEAIDRVLTEREDWKGLARAYRRMLKRVGEGAPAERLLELWTRLGDICLDHLGDTEQAIAALEVAADLAPEDLERREQLAELYLAAGEPRRADAVEELQALLVHSPDRVELYKALAGLYRAEGDLDKAWCVAQTLVFLGAASDEERVLFERYRPARFAPPSRRLTEELWQKAVMHPREDRHVGAIFATTLGALAAPGAQPPEAFGLDPARRADLERDTRPAVRVARHAVSVLALDPVPMVWPVEGGEGLQVANTMVPVAGADRGRLVPSLLLGAPQLARSDERELAFELGKRLAYLRPERYVNVALPALPGLEGAFYGALRAAGTDVGGEDTRRTAQSLAGQLAAPVLEQVAALASKINGKLGNGLLTGWRSAADLTANRIGFILCNDLEVAARSIATETAAMSGLPVKDRLRDLLAYSVSEPYFQVRRHLGLDVRDDAAS